MNKRRKFTLKVRSSKQRLKTKPETKAEAQVYRKDIRAREIQVEKAVDWCKENNKRGQAALKTGKFPLIKDRGTIDRRLDSKLKNLKKDHLRILDEENEIVRYIKNKNRAQSDTATSLSAL